jgi:RNA polymerase sigma-70 factor, ECF subfamily
MSNRKVTLSIVRVPRVVPDVRDTGADGPRDEELVRACRRQEPHAPAAIWDRYYPVVRRLMYRTMGPGRDVDDVIQEVFFRLFRKLPDLREPSALRSFVLSITVRVIKGEQRLRWIKRWLGLSPDGETPDRAGDPVDLEAREALSRFYAILDRLSPRHRTAFVLRHVEGLELTEVAAALDISLATVKRWLPRIAGRVFSQAQGDPLLAPYLAVAAPEASDS